MVGCIEEVINQERKVTTYTGVKCPPITKPTNPSPLVNGNPHVVLPHENTNAPGPL